MVLGRGPLGDARADAAVIGAALTVIEDIRQNPATWLDSLYQLTPVKTSSCHPVFVEGG